MASKSTSGLESLRSRLKASQKARESSNKKTVSNVEQNIKNTTRRTVNFKEETRKTATKESLEIERAAEQVKESQSRGLPSGSRNLIASGSLMSDRSLITIRNRQVTKSGSSSPKMFGGGTITAAPESSVTDRAKSIIRGAANTFYSGFTLQNPNPRYDSLGSTIRNAPPSESIPAFAGTIAGIGSLSLGGFASTSAKGVQAARGANVGARVLSASTNTAKAASSGAARVSASAGSKARGLGRSAATLGKDIAFNVPSGIAISEGTQAVGRSTEDATSARLSNKINIESVLNNAFAAEAQSFAFKQDDSIFGKGKKFAGGLANSVNSFFSVNKKDFIASVRQQGKDAGLSKSEIDDLVRLATRRRRFAASGELAGVLSVSRGAEAIGRREVSRAFLARESSQIAKKGSFNEIFKTTFVPIGKAGIVEGVGQQAVQDTARSGQIKPKDAAIGGTVGFFTAGLGGGVIAGLAPTRRGASRTVETVLSIADPTEKPADILQDINERVSRQLFGRKTVSPTIRETGNILELGTKTTSKGGKQVFSFVPSMSTSTSTTSTSKGRGRSIVAAPNIQFASSAAPTGSDPFSISFGSSTPVPSPINTRSNVPVTPSAFVPTDTVGTPAEVPVTTNTNTPSSIFSPVPVVTAAPKFLPPLPFVPSFGLGSGSTRRGKTTFIGELGLARGLFANNGSRFFSTDLGLPKRKKVTKSKSGGSKKKKRRGRR